MQSKEVALFLLIVHIVLLIMYLYFYLRGISKIYTNTKISTDTRRRARLHMAYGAGAMTAHLGIDLAEQLTYNNKPQWFVLAAGMFMFSCLTISSIAKWKMPSES